jgi:hypothetical protein
VRKCGASFKSREAVLRAIEDQKVGKQPFSLPDSVDCVDQNSNSRAALSGPAGLSRSSVSTAPSEPLGSPPRAQPPPPPASASAPQRSTRAPVSVKIDISKFNFDASKREAKPLAPVKLFEAPKMPVVIYATPVLVLRKEITTSPRLSLASRPKTGGWRGR